MNADQWGRVSTLFDQALQMPADDRANWLASIASSGEEPATIAHVERMLAAHSESDRFLDSKVEDAASDLLLEASSDNVPDRIGPFRLVEEIGAGGMGKVYRGRRVDGQFEQVVAIKLLRPSLVEGHLERRFLSERRILASLDHPNVARLLDGGVTEMGLPYFVMEFIDGMPITEHFIAENVPVQKRLESFLEVCEAVVHAHQKLVIHRDLKPGNILVTPAGDVKLLDFGIAKLLEADDGTSNAPPETMAGLHLMTPEFASPEQVRGDQITTASDVYQLGLLLFEILTGHRLQRLKSKSLTEIARVVCETDAPRPSSIENHTGLKGDLDAIILKALRKEPASRYVSVSDLADDVRRHLDGFPVSAHAGSTGYVLRKLAKRYRWQAGTAVVILLLTLGSSVGLLLQNARIARERDRAEQYSGFLTDLLASPDPFVADARVNQREITVREVLDRARVRIFEDLAADREMQVDLLKTVASVQANLADNDRIRDQLRETLDLSIEVYGRQHESTLEIMRLLAVATKDYDEADSLHQDLLTLARDAEPGGGISTHHILISYGEFLTWAAQLDKADTLLTEAYELERRLGLQDRASNQEAAFHRGRLSRMLGDYELADSMLHIAYESRIRISGQGHPGTAVVLTEFGQLYALEGNITGAVEVETEALGIFETRLGVDHPFSISTLNNLALRKSAQDSLQKAEEFMRLVLERSRTRYGENTENVMDAIQNLGRIVLDQNNVPEAEILFNQALEGYRAVLPATHFRIAFPMLSLTSIYLDTGRFEQARRMAREAHVQLRHSLPPDHPIVVIAAGREGAAAMGSGDIIAGRAQLDQALEALGTHGGYARYRDELVEWGTRFD